MSMHFVYDRHAVEDLRLFSRKIADHITTKIAWYASQDDPLHFAKKLKPPFNDLYRFRIGDYRAIFEIEPKKEIRLLFILRIKHRKYVYK